METASGAFAVPRGRAGVGNFGLYPIAVHARVGHDQQELVADADGFVDLFVELPAALDVLRGEPAADSARLQV